MGKRNHPKRRQTPPPPVVLPEEPAEVVDAAPRQPSRSPPALPPQAVADVPTTSSPPSTTSPGNSSSCRTSPRRIQFLLPDVVEVPPTSTSVMAKVRAKISPARPSNEGGFPTSHHAMILRGLGLIILLVLALLYRRYTSAQPRLV